MKLQKVIGYSIAVLLITSCGGNSSKTEMEQTALLANPFTCPAGQDCGFIPNPNEGGPETGNTDPPPQNNDPTPEPEAPAQNDGNNNQANNDPNNTPSSDPNGEDPSGNNNTANNNGSGEEDPSGEDGNIANNSDPSGGESHSGESGNIANNGENNDNENGSNDPNNSDPNDSSAESSNEQANNNESNSEENDPNNTQNNNESESGTDVANNEEADPNQQGGSEEEGSEGGEVAQNDPDNEDSNENETSSTSTDQAELENGSDEVHAENPEELIPPAPEAGVKHAEVTINRGCSLARSFMEDFIFFEETTTPILEAKLDSEHYKALQKRHERLLAFLNDPTRVERYTRYLGSRFIDRLRTQAQNAPPQIELEEDIPLMAAISLAGLDLLVPEPDKVPMTYTLDEIKASYPENWGMLPIKVSVCNDLLGIGACSAYIKDLRQHNVTLSPFTARADSMPNDIPVTVWSGRNRVLRDFNFIKSRARSPEMYDDIVIDETVCEVQYSPLVLDTNGDGVLLSGPGSGVVFDINDTGNAVQTGWTGGRDDAFLVRDLNGNGVIDTGAELFGSATRMPDGTRADNGFEALKVLDSNDDKMFSSQDEAWNKVMLWIDENHNGFSEIWELHDLASKGIDSINLDYENILDTDVYGNQTRQRSTYNQWRNDKYVASLIIDVWFNTLK